MSVLRSSSVFSRGITIFLIAGRQEPAALTAATLASLVYAGTTVAAARVLGSATDDLIIPAALHGAVERTALVATGALFAGIAVFRMLAFVVRRYTAGLLEFRLQAHFRSRVTDSYLRLPLAWHQRRSSGELLATANADIEDLCAPVSLLPLSLSAAIMLVLALVDMMATDLVLALVGVSLFPLILALNSRYQRRAGPLAAVAQEARGEVSSLVHESFDGAVVVKALGREQHETERMRRAGDTLRWANVAAGTPRAFFDTMMDALPAVGVLATLAVGVVRISAGAVGPGDVVHISYLITTLAFPVLSIGWVLSALPRSVSGHERVLRVIDEPCEETAGTVSELPPGEIGLLAEGIDFTYPSTHETVLHNVTVSLAPGRTVALVGPTGSGKSTLTYLLAGLLAADRGTIAIGGIPVGELSREGLTQSVALVPQVPFLFAGTVRSNLALAEPRNEADMWAALRLARAEDFVRRLPGGLDAQVEERGANLSGGQRQRIALARALLRDPGLLILDDATSAVDTVVEKEILTGLRNEVAQPTILLIAHRMSAVEQADRVIYLKDGRVIDSGSHHVLLSRCVGYREHVTAYQSREGR